MRANYWIEFYRTILEKTFRRNQGISAFIEMWWLHHARGHPSGYDFVTKSIGSFLTKKFEKDSKRKAIKDCTECDQERPYDDTMALICSNDCNLTKEAKKRFEELMEQEVQPIDIFNIMINHEHVLVNQHKREKQEP